MPRTELGTSRLRPMSADYTIVTFGLQLNSHRNMCSQRIFRLCVKKNENGNVSPHKRFQLQHWNLTITLSDSFCMTSAASTQKKCRQYTEPLFVSILKRGHNFFMCSGSLRAIVYSYPCLNTRSQHKYSASYLNFTRRAAVLSSVGRQIMPVSLRTKPPILLPKNQL